MGTVPVGEVGRVCSMEAKPHLLSCSTQGGPCQGVAHQITLPGELHLWIKISA